jgi:hypothetical protein
MKRIALFAAVVALGVAPDASTPSPAPVPSGAAGVPLREIGRTSAVSPSCINTVVHANAAIAAALHDDESLTHAIATLKVVDLEANDLKRTQGLRMLDKNAVELRHAAEVGLSEVTRLRELAKQTKDPTIKKELTAFADALGGALYRQKTAAVDMQRMVVIVEGHESMRDSARDVKQTQEDDFRNRGQLPEPDAFSGSRTVGSTNPGDPGPHTLGSMGENGDLRNLAPATPSARSARTDHEYNAMAKEAAKSLEGMEPDILRDEGTAASHTDGAISGC